MFEASDRSVCGCAHPPKSPTCLRGSSICDSHLLPVFCLQLEMTPSRESSRDTGRAASRRQQLWKNLVLGTAWCAQRQGSPTKAVACWPLVFRVSLVPLPVWVSLALTVRFASIFVLLFPAIHVEAACGRLLSQTGVSRAAFTEGLLSALPSSHLTSKVGKPSPGRGSSHSCTGSEWRSWDPATGSSCSVDQTSKCQSGEQDSREPLDSVWCEIGLCPP